jgi:hypothetical protein
MQICSLIKFAHVKFPPANNPPSTPLKKPPKNSSAQKSIFKLLKPQIEQTLVLPEYLPPPPLFFWAFFLLVFFWGYLNIPKSPKTSKMIFQSLGT